MSLLSDKMGRFISGTPFEDDLVLHCDFCEKDFPAKTFWEYGVELETGLACKDCADSPRVIAKRIEEKLGSNS